MVVQSSNIAKRLTAIVFLTILVRLVAMVYLNALGNPSYVENRQIAMNLMSGNGYSLIEFANLGPTSQKPPVYPLLLAGAYKLFGSDQNLAHCAMLGINIIASIISVVLIYKLVKAISNHTGAGLVSAWLFAIFPTQIYAATCIQGLCIAMCLLLLGLVCILDSVKNDRTLRAIVAGLCIAMSMLTESVLVPMGLGIVLVILLCEAKSFGARMRSMALVLVAMGILVGPWMYRNWVVQQRLTGITGVTAIDLWRGNHPSANGSEPTRGHVIETLTAEQRAALKGKVESQRIGLMQTWAIDWITHHPVEYVRLCASRVGKIVWTDWNHPKSMKLLNVISRSLGLVVLLFAIIRSFSKVGTVRRLSRIAWVLTGMLVLSTVFTVAAARNATFVDLPVVLLLGIYLTGHKQFTDNDLHDTPDQPIKSPQSSSVGDAYVQ